MRFNDPQTEWRIDGISRQASDAKRTAEQANYEISSLREHVARVERTNGELSASLNELRYELQALREEVLPTVN